jgi:hypothetical protein
LILQANGEIVEILAAGSLKMPLALKKGHNDKLSSGDTRTLLLGIKWFSVRAAD